MCLLYSIYFFTIVFLPFSYTSVPKNNKACQSKNMISLLLVAVKFAQENKITQGDKLHNFAQRQFCTRTLLLEQKTLHVIIFFISFFINFVLFYLLTLLPLTLILGWYLLFNYFFIIILFIFFIITVTPYPRSVTFFFSIN